MIIFVMVGIKEEVFSQVAELVKSWLMKYSN